MGVCWKIVYIDMNNELEGYLLFILGVLLTFISFLIVSLYEEFLSDETSNSLIDRKSIIVKYYSLESNIMQLDKSELESFIVELESIKLQLKTNKVKGYCHIRRKNKDLALINEYIEKTQILKEMINKWSKNTRTIILFLVDVLDLSKQ